MVKAREHDKVDSALLSSFWSPGRKKQAVSHEIEGKEVPRIKQTLYSKLKSSFSEVIEGLFRAWKAQ